MDWILFDFLGSIQNNDDVDDLLNVEMSEVHFLSGPIAVEGAEPGDLLIVDILDIGALPGREWGFTGLFFYHSWSNSLFSS